MVTMHFDNGMTAEETEYLPNVAGAYAARGSIYIKRGESDAAIADLNKSIAINPFFGALHVRGRELRKRGDLNAAIADFSKAIELGPQRLGPHLPLLLIERRVSFVEAGKDDEAETDFAQALALAPHLKTTVENRRAEARKVGDKKLP